MSKFVQVTVSIGKTTVSLQTDTVNNNGPVSIYGADELTQDELAFIAAISGMIRALASEHPISYVFRPEQECDMERMVSCEWLSSGTLRIKPGTVHRPYQHAETRDEAVSRLRSFTCKYGLAIRLPNKRHLKAHSSSVTRKEE